MQTRIAGVFLVLVVILTSAGLAGDDDDTRTFINEMLTGVGATMLDCPVAVRERIEQREMQVVCAQFDGDFNTFESRWTLHILQDTIYDKNYGGGAIPHFQARTGWEVSGMTHDRIYSIGPSTLGVRFTDGEILMVFK